jgi:hypothetical protein
MKSTSPFQHSYDQAAVSAIEFRVFQEKAPEAIRRSCAKLNRFKSLEELFGFYVHVHSEDTVQAWFGARSMFRKGVHEELAIEKGLTLLYSKGATGEVVVSLYPCASNLAHTHESQIHVRIGRYTAYELLRSIPSDVADLVAYGYVSSLDGSPTFREKFRIWLLRKSCPAQVEGKFTKPAMSAYLYRGLELSSKTLLGAVFGAVLKPIGLVIAVLLLGYLGFTHLISLIKAQ